MLYEEEMTQEAERLGRLGGEIAADVLTDRELMED